MSGPNMGQNKFSARDCYSKAPVKKSYRGPDEAQAWQALVRREMSS